MNLKKTKVQILRKITILQRLSGLKNFKEIFNMKKEIEKKFNEYDLNDGYIEISKKNLDIYKKAFLKFRWFQSKEANLYKLFLEAKIKVGKLSFDKNSIEESEPILICVVKNDLERIKMSLIHYRNIGFKYFVYIDNKSDDGTFEYLKSQDDVNIYVCETEYTSINREAWINRIISHYGFNRWYLCVDSDELFAYENFEKISIQEYIKKANELKIRRIRSVMIDMYSKNNIFSEDDSLENIQDVYCYFDSDTYYSDKSYKYEIVRGGPRERLLKNNESKPQFLLTKYPLFKFMPGDIQGYSHFQYPYKYNYNIPCTSVLLHYKFLYSDFEKYKIRVEKQNYSSGSLEYKTYLNAYYSGKELSFYNSKSKKFESSYSLKQISVLKNIFEIKGYKINV